jgi:hypothetical protein
VTLSRRIGKENEQENEQSMLDLLILHLREASGACAHYLLLDMMIMIIISSIMHNLLFMFILCNTWERDTYFNAHLSDQFFFSFFPGNSPST